MNQNQRMITLVLLSTLFSIGHHVDHIIRGNHVGWPLIPEVTPFSYSLVFYPVIAAGLYLYIRNRAVPGFWAVLTGIGFLFVGLAHFGPIAVEPPADILGPYDSEAAGYTALAWLIVFLLMLGNTSIYATRLWLKQRHQVRIAGKQDSTRMP